MIRARGWRVYAGHLCRASRTAYFSGTCSSLARWGGHAKHARWLHECRMLVGCTGGGPCTHVGTHARRAPCVAAGRKWPQLMAAMRDDLQAEVHPSGRAMHLGHCYQVCRVCLAAAHVPTPVFRRMSTPKAAGSWVRLGACRLAQRRRPGAAITTLPRYTATTPSCLASNSAHANGNACHVPAHLLAVSAPPIRTQAGAIYSHPGAL